MTNSEFSDTFTTLLNSYNTQAAFGEQASKREIVLDEYEKSVLLTQAQDIIIKSYFDSTLNQQGQGFDDSTRRQMDFSSLIKVAELTPLAVSAANNPIDENDKDAVTASDATLLHSDDSLSLTTMTAAQLKAYTTKVEPFDDRGLIYQLPRKIIMNKDSATGRYNGLQTVIEDTTDVLFILNERLIAKKTVSTSPEAYKNKDYVIVPISYKEYDREMSKPYAQPLKKQAWRLFQNSAVGFDINSELIPRFNVVPVGDGTHVGDVQFIYKIRYVKRPRPIILEDLPNDLEIDGESQESSCELNPIIHMDILNKAVELAITTRGGTSGSQERQAAEQRR